MEQQNRGTCREALTLSKKSHSMQNAVSKHLNQLTQILRTPGTLHPFVLPTAAHVWVQV